MKTTDNKSAKKTTTAKQLAILREAKFAADKAFSDYRKLYNEEHEVEGGSLIKEIIALHREGKSNAEIVDAGYNKNTVSRQVSLYKKGIRVEKTTVSVFLPKKKKGSKNEEIDEEEEMEEQEG